MHVKAGQAMGVRRAARLSEAVSSTAATEVQVSTWSNVNMLGRAAGIYLLHAENPIAFDCPYSSSIWPSPIIMTIIHFLGTFHKMMHNSAQMT